MKPSRRHSRSQERPTSGDRYWLFGTHPCAAALANPARLIHRAALTQPMLDEWRGPLAKRSLEPAVIESRELAGSLPPGAVHQGVALQVSPLPATDLEDIYDSGDDAVILLLDQVTDPHNVGAILRSAAAFDVAAVVVTADHAPPETGTLAKSASGALELVPLVRVVNLVDALGRLKKHGWWVAGLDGEAPGTLAQAKLTGKRALVMGAEGAGMRQLTRKHCDFLVRLPISARMESLNVSNAAAVALYELRRG